MSASARTHTHVKKRTRVHTHQAYYLQACIWSHSWLISGHRTAETERTVKAAGRQTRRLPMKHLQVGVRYNSPLLSYCCLYCSKMLLWCRLNNSSAPEKTSKSQHGPNEQLKSAQVFMIILVLMTYLMLEQWGGPSLFTIKPCSWLGGQELDTAPVHSGPKWHHQDSMAAIFWPHFCTRGGSGDTLATIIFTWTKSSQGHFWPT